MTQMPAPSSPEFRARMLARLSEIRRVLKHTEAAVARSADPPAEFRRLLDALDELERRVREILAA